MKGLDAQLFVNMGMKHGDVAVPDDPFGFFKEVCEIKAVNNADGAVSPPGTNDRPDFIIVEHLLHVPATLGVGAGKLVIFAENMRPQYNLQVVTLKKADGRVNFLEGDAPCRGDDADLVAFDQVWGVDHAPKVKKRSGILPVNSYFCFILNSIAMIRKPALIFMICLSCWPVFLTGQPPIVFVAFNYLDFNLDARIAGTGGISVVAPRTCPEAGLRLNPALLCTDQRFFTVSNNSSSILRLEDISNWGTELTGSFAFNRNNVVGLSVSYLDHGTIYFEDQGDPESMYSAKYFDLFAKLSYAHSFGKGFSLGGAFRYSRSDYNHLVNITGKEVKNVVGVAFDLGFSYYKAFQPAKWFRLDLNAGLDATPLISSLNL